ncbi:MAG: diacylglycerol kinase family lipid kinase [Alphaproteobacteria bacterium]|nr:diacylglycerol kinase family lipid kinase [Alphaproteobacteria bacterium]
MATAPYRQIAIIHNPVAGGRRGVLLDQVVDRLRLNGHAIDLRRTTAPGDGEALARALCASEAPADVVVAAGGDGTVNEVINGLVGGSPPLAIIPIGTANVLADELGLPRAADGLAAVIAGTRRRRIHLGQVNDRYFAMMAGIGLDAWVVDRVNPRLKRCLGKLAYVIETARRLAIWGIGPYRVVIDGTAHHCASAILANGHFYGGRFVAAPEARLDAPELDVVLFPRGGRRAAIGYALALLTGGLPRRGDVKIVKARAITVAGPAGEPIQADGDRAARLPATIRAAAATLDVLVP